MSVCFADLLQLDFSGERQPRLTLQSWMVLGYKERGTWATERPYVSGETEGKELWKRKLDEGHGPTRVEKGVSGEADTAPCLFAQEGGISEHPARGRSWTLCPKGTTGSAGLQDSYGTASGCDLHHWNKREPSPHIGTWLDPSGLSGISSSRGLPQSWCYIRKGKQECMLTSWCELIKPDKTSKSKYRQCSRPGHRLVLWFDRSLPNICSVKKKTCVCLCNIGEWVRICVCAILLQSHKRAEWLMSPCQHPKGHTACSHWSPVASIAGGRCARCTGCERTCRDLRMLTQWWRVQVCVRLQRKPNILFVKGSLLVFLAEHVILVFASLDKRNEEQQ